MFGMRQTHHDQGPPHYILVDQEVPFGIGELFFSRTDTRGVIRAFNPVFLRVAGYGAEDMIKTSDALKVLDPSTVPVRDCRGFPTQPFGRCYVSFVVPPGLRM